jgi:hypothetical protein
MPQEIGESREKLGWDVVHMVEDFANKMKSEERPFYIVYACKEDKGMSKKLGTFAFKQAIRAYYSRPPAMLGILVWYVNHKEGRFEFVPELSAPPDVPLDPKLLSDKASDASDRVMGQGKKLKAIVS